MSRMYTNRWTLKPVQMTNLEGVMEGSQEVNWIFFPPLFPAKRVSAMHKKRANTQDIILQRISERVVLLEMFGEVTLEMESNLQAVFNPILLGVFGSYITRGYLGGNGWELPKLN